MRTIPFGSGPLWAWCSGSHWVAVSPWYAGYTMQCWCGHRFIAS